MYYVIFTRNKNCIRERERGRGEGGGGGEGEGEGVWGYLVKCLSKICKTSIFVRTDPKLPF